MTTETQDIRRQQPEKPRNPEPQTTDVVIVGGGVVGLAQAVALADGGISVAVVDAADPAEARGAEFDGRAFAVAYSSQLMLQTLGVWKHLEGRTQPINDILVFDGKPGSRFKRGGPSPFFLHFDHRGLDSASDGAPLGSMVEARHAQSLRDYLGAQCSKIVIIDPEKLWFTGTLQGAVLLLAEKKKESGSHSKGLGVHRVKDREFVRINPERIFKDTPTINGKTLKGKWTHDQYDRDIQNRRTRSLRCLCRSRGCPCRRRIQRVQRRDRRRRAARPARC